jgi:hypothetical protein
MYTFDTSKFSTEDKVRNFPKFVRRQHTARFLARWEIFKRQLEVKAQSLSAAFIKVAAYLVGDIIQPHLNHTTTTEKSLDSIHLKAFHQYMRRMESVNKQGLGTFLKT